MNGKPGDHPITDIVRHRIARYGDPLDSQIRQLGELMSYHRLCDWFEQHWSRSPQQLEPIVAAKLEEMRRSAQEGGWETIGH
jgi:hypothetical protein